jgi:hypothetical protein
MQAQDEHEHEQLMDHTEQDHAYQEHHEQQRSIIEQKGSFAELVVKAAAACNKIIVENCSVCTLYCDKQVQYETAVMERYVTGAALTDLFRTLDADPDVEEFREKLFDEQSVVQSVSSRQEE